MLRNNKRWLVVAGSMIGLVVGSGSIKIFAFSVLLKPTSDALGLQRSSIGLAFLIGNIAAMVCTPIYGRLIDIHGIRAISVPAIVCWSLTMAAFSLLTPENSWLIFPLYIASGIFSIAQTPLPYSKAVTAWFDDKRGLALGIAVSGVGIGGLLMPQYVQFVIDGFGWRWAYAAIGAAIFIVAVPVVGGLIREPQGAAGVARQARSKALVLTVVKDAVRKHQFWSLALIFFFAVAAINGVLSNFAALLSDRGIDGRSAANAVSIAGGAIVLGRVLCGYLLDRFHTPYVAAVMFLVPLASCLAIASSSSPALVMLGAAGVGLGVGAEVDILGYLTSRYFSLASYGTIYGILFSLVTAGSAFGPFAVGVLYQRSGNYSAALLLAAASLGVSALICLFLGRYPVLEPTAVLQPPSATIPGLASTLHP